MADKWLLEDGSGSWTLEESIDYWILEEQAGGGRSSKNCNNITLGLNTGVERMMG